MPQSLNDPSVSAAGQVRYPRPQLLLNGRPVPNLERFSVESNNHYRADTYHASFALGPSNQPLGALDTITVELKAGFATDPHTDPVFTSLLIGEVDLLEIDPIAGIVDISGRDLTRRFIDNKTQETFLNQTSSQIATTLAKRRGLTPVVTATSTKVDRYYTADHDRTTQGEFSRTITEWDLLTYLAQHEGFDCFVKGFELHFQPATAITDPPFIVRMDMSGPSPVCNVLNPHWSRSLTLAADITVEVRSWSSATASRFTKVSGPKNSKSSDAQRVVLIRPNLTQDAAQKLADSTRADMTQHERTLEFSMPADVTLTARNLVQLQGTQTSWDQVYFVSSIHRDISIDGGFVAQVHCKNSSPESESIPA